MVRSKRGADKAPAASKPATKGRKKSTATKKADEAAKTVPRAAKKGASKKLLKGKVAQKQPANRVQNQQGHTATANLPPTEGISESEIEESDDEDDDKENFFKFQLTAISKKKMPKRPTKLNCSDDQALQSQGLNDFQINSFLTKTGFQDVGVGYLCKKGHLVVLKSGYARFLLTKDHKHYALPSSMTVKDWKDISLFRQNGADIAIFITKEYVQLKFLSELRKNSPIPTDKQIRGKYAWRYVKEGGRIVGRKDEESHTSILHIRGMRFTLYDVNNWKGVHEIEGNEHVQKFFDVFKRYALYRITKHLDLDITDVRDNYAEKRCYITRGVSNSCANYLLFLCEQLADEHSVLDVNFSPTLAQLFHYKIMHHVEGKDGMSFRDFVLQNPDWNLVIQPFLHESLLTQLKVGTPDIDVLELKDEMEKFSSTHKYKLV